MRMIQMTQTTWGLGTEPRGIGKLRHLQIRGALGPAHVTPAPGTTPTLQVPDQILAPPALQQDCTILDLGVTQTPLVPDAILTLQGPEVRSIPELLKSQIILGPREIRTTQNRDATPVLQLPKAVETMSAPEQIQIILPPGKNQITPELRKFLPTIRAPREIQDVPLPARSPPSISCQNLIILGLRVNRGLGTFGGNQTISVLRITGSLQTFGESLTTQALKVMILALLRPRRRPAICLGEHLQSSPHFSMRVLARGATLRENMKTTLKALN